MGLVYIVTNRVNGKKYVGQTVQTLAARWRGHRSEAKRTDRHLYRAIRKYGPENFSVIGQYVLFDEFLDSIEKREIARLGTTTREKGYNILVGGKGSRPSEDYKKECDEVLKVLKSEALTSNTWEAYYVGFPKYAKYVPQIKAWAERKAQRECDIEFVKFWNANTSLEQRDQWFAAFPPEHRFHALRQFVDHRGYRRALQDPVFREMRRWVNTPYSPVTGRPSF